MQVGRQRKSSSAPLVANEKVKSLLDRYEAQKPQFPRGIKEAVPNPYVGPYEDLNLSKARQSGVPTMAAGMPTSARSAR